MGMYRAELAEGQADGSAGKGEAGPAPLGGADALLDLLSMPACLLDQDARVVSSNPAWRALQARPTLVDCVFPEDRPAVQAHFWALAAVSSAGGPAGGPAGMADGDGNIECRLLDSRGAPRWFVVQLQPATGAPGGRRWLCVATDIDRLKAREMQLEQRAAIQTDMLDISVDCIKLIALDGTIVHMNRSGCRALGVSGECGFGMPWLQLLPEDVHEAGERALATARAGEFARFAGKSALPGQNPQYWDNMLTPVLDAEGRATAILCVSREVTAEREALDALRESRERLAIAVGVGGIGVWDYEIASDYLYCDKTWYQVMGRDPEEPIRSLTEFQPFIHPEDRERATEVAQTAAELIATNKDYAIEFRILRPSGEVRWVRSAACLVQNEEGVPARAIGFVIDVTDARRGEMALRDANRLLQEEKSSLARQSLEDPLTGIANRRYLDRELARICDHADETGGPVAVGMIDVDHFKPYNDRYGHTQGDEALRKVAEALQSVARQSDFVARYGGEEFVFIMSGVADPAPALARFAAAVARLAIVHEDSPTGYVTVSCGCAVFQSCADLSPAHLLELSDEVLYLAKSQGRNRYVVRTATAAGITEEPTAAR